MKLFNAQQVRDWDAFTIEHEPISSTQLMERAAGHCADWLLERFANRTFKVFCGKGNNGGDGLVIGRLLMLAGQTVEIFVLQNGKQGSNDFEINLSRLNDIRITVKEIADTNDFPVLTEKDIIVECLFGSGLSRPLEGLAAQLVSHLNKSGAQIISIDVPAGLFTDKSSKQNTVIEASQTLTFQTTKPAFLLAENSHFTGKVSVLDIGLHPAYAKKTSSIYELTTESDVADIFRPRNDFSHKGTFGHSLIVAGSKGKMGAAILASKACLRSGTGLVTAVVPEWGMTTMQSAFPEAMAVCTNDIDGIDFDTYQAIGIGPGLGTTHDATTLLRHIIVNFGKPMVIDADALNILSRNTGWLADLPKNSILTPHPKEFERLFGKTGSDFEKLDVALEQAQQNNLVIVLKGHKTLVATPSGKGHFNSTGNAGMATAGSGDVLTGILTGLLSQGYEPAQAAILGVFLHGLAGEQASKQLSQEAMIAGDIIENLGKAFTEVAGNKKDPRNEV